MVETPFYQFSLNKVKDNYRQLKNELNVDKLFYALKPNSEIPILKALNEEVADFEIASLGEYYKLKSLAVNPERIICSLPVKKISMIEELYANKINYFVFENLFEYEKLQQFAPGARKIIRLSVVDFVSNAIEFGVNITDFYNWINQELINPDKIDGVTFYISKNKDVDKVLTALDRCEDVLKIVGKDKIINLGGNYRLCSEVGNAFYSKLNDRLFLLKSKYNCILFAEPGRSIVKSAGSLVTTVIATKQNENCQYVYLDAGFPTGISYAPKNISIVSKPKNIRTQHYKFFDITCSHRLLFKIDLNYDLEEDDVLIFEDFGSYSICKASNFHGWDKPGCIYINE